MKAAQVIPYKTITMENVVESVQLLYDLLGTARFGREGTSAYVAGCKLMPMSAYEELDERLKQLENERIQYIKQ